MQKTRTENPVHTYSVSDTPRLTRLLKQKKQKSNGKYAYTANADRTDPDLFTISVKDAADGSVLIGVFSADKDVITGTSGELIRLPLDVASTVTTSLQGSIKYIEFTDVNSQAHNIADVTMNFTLGTSPQPSGNITFADANVKALCVANWDTNGDGELSRTEAAAVTNLGTVFQNYQTITSFDELQYFTGLTTIGANAFSTCHKLTSVIIPEGVQTIGEQAFYWCDLRTVTISSTVRSIGRMAFEDNKNLESVYSMIQEPFAIDDDVFDYEYGNDNYEFTDADLYVPKGTKAKYLATDGWKEFGNYIYEIGDPATVTAAPTAKTLTYTGSAQQLVNAGTASGGTMQYSLDGTTYGTSIPTGTDAKTYTVYYKVVGDDTHLDTEPATVSVTIKKADSSVTTAPTAKKLTYTGSAQELVTAGVATGGTLQYSLDGTNYNTDIPTGTNAGNYTVYYKVVGDANHNSTTPATVSATVDEAPLTITAKSYTITQGDPLPVFEAEFSGFVNGETSNVLTTMPTFSCSATSTSSPGTYDIVVSDAEAQNYAMTYENGTLTIEAPSVTMGDLNDDGVVDGVDLVAQTNLIMTNQYVAAADLNNDGVVDGADYVVMVNRILNFTASAPALSAGNSNRAASTASLSIEDFDIRPGETKTMMIDLSNPNTELTLVQFDLRLPEGLTMVMEGDGYAVDIAGRTTWRRHSLMANAMDGVTRLLLASSTNAVIGGDSGNVISITLTADNDFRGGDIRLENQLLVTPDATSTKPADYIFAVGDATSIESVMAGQPADVYTLTGKKVRHAATSLDGLPKGVYIIKGKKVTK